MKKNSTRQRSQSNGGLRFESLETRELLATLYVATDGNDLQTQGTIDRPFATVNRASIFARPGDTVLIREGTYRTTATTRSGTEGAPITYAAFPGEEVVFSGGDLVTGWSPVSGQTDVWVANVPWNANDDREANTLFVNGELKFEAREQAEDDPLNIDDWGLLPQGNLTTTTLRSNDLVGAGDDFWNGAKIRFHRNDFDIETRTIADYDSSLGLVTFDTPIGTPNQKQAGGFFIFDTLDALDRPGEWYKGKVEDGPGEQNRLYYKAEPGQNPNSLEIEFKRRAYGFDTRGRDHVNIEGITFRGVSIQTDGSTDFNTYSGNTLYGFDKDNFGRFFIEGDNNTFRDNSVSQLWNTVATIGGVRNAFVNNLVVDTGYNGIAKGLIASNAVELLVSHNTVRRFAEAFLDGYPTRGEIAYNVFEEGGLLSFDTGVFDSDGQNGNSSQTIFHHNIFRNTDSRGIYEAFYGRNDNTVIHHNLFYDFSSSPSSRPSLRTTGIDFRQAFHNTVISSFEASPLGTSDAREAIQTRYNNNVQINIDRIEALGVDIRGNFDYSPSDFVDFAGRDFQLAAGSGAVDTGILLPGINDDFVGDAPDAGAFEFGQDPWVAGHNFDDPPEAVYDWQPLPGTNIYANGQFRQGFSDWTVVSGTPNSSDRNSFNIGASGASLTGTFRTRSVEFTPGEAITRTFDGLQPNTTYTLGTAARVANEVFTAGQPSATLGSITTATHRGVSYATDLSAGEWLRFDGIDFGESGQFDQLDVLHIRDPSSGFPQNIGGVTIEARLDSPDGPLLAEYSDLSDGQLLDRWRADRSDFLTDVSGVRSVYISVSGFNSPNLAIGSFRLLKEAPPAGDLLTVSASSPGAQSATQLVGGPDWRQGFEELVFTTGPTATTIDVLVANNGRLNAYLDRLYLVEGASTRGGQPRDVSSGAAATVSTSPTTIGAAPSLTDGDVSTEIVTGDHPGAWAQVDLGRLEGIYSIEVATAPSQPERLSNVRVSVWTADPDRGGTQLWAQDYLTDGASLAAGESLYIQGDQLGLGGGSRLGEVEGRFVRVELLGPNNAGDNRLALGELRVLGFDEFNAGLTDGIVTQSSIETGADPTSINDGDPTTFSSTQASDSNSWIQARLPQGFGIGRIELVNQDGENFGELSNFTVSVWDEDPEAGGTRVWEKSFFSTGSVGRGATLTIDGSEIDGGGTTRRLASVHTGRVVRVQLNGTNNLGNGRLSLAELRVTPADAAPPINNLAQRGVASQRNDFYGDAGAVGTTAGQAFRANNGVIFPRANFTSALREPNGWWQVDLQEASPIDQIVLFNRTDAGFRLDDFFVEVWSDDPDNGGTLLWERFFGYSNFASTYSTGNTIGPGGALIIDGSDQDGGLRLDQVQGGRYVRVQLTDSEILSLVEVQVWAPDTLLRLPSGQDGLVFDLGTEQSAVAAGAQRVSPTTFGDVTWTGDVQAVDRGGSGAERDFVTSAGPATLNTTVGNGFYRVTVDFGDPLTARQDVMLWAEGELISGDIDSVAGAPTQVAFDIAVSDGELNLAFDTADGAPEGWAVSRVAIEDTTPVIALAGDYNEDRVVDVADFTVWRDALGTGAVLPNDATPGVVDVNDYQVWRDNFGASLPVPTATVLIDASTGNGEFEFGDPADASPVGGGSEQLNTDVDRDRALRSTSAAGRGIAVPGWELVRVSYPGDNAALGLDGNFGFAQDAGTDPGQTGQAFVNSGSIGVVSDPISFSFSAGDQIDLSYLLGSDTTGTPTVDADVSLVFNQGQPTEFTHVFSTRSATGLTTPAISETYTVAAPADSLSARFQIDGRQSGIRAVLDRVELTVTPDAAPAATASVVAAASVAEPAPAAEPDQSAEPVAPQRSTVFVASAAAPVSDPPAGSPLDASAARPSASEDELLLLLAADVAGQQPAADESLYPLEGDAADKTGDYLEDLAAALIQRGLA